MLRPTFIAPLRKIKKDEEWQQRLKTFEEVSQKVEKKINDQKSWFPVYIPKEKFSDMLNLLLITKGKEQHALRIHQRLQ